MASRDIFDENLGGGERNNPESRRKERRDGTPVFDPAAELPRAGKFIEAEPGNLELMPTSTRLVADLMDAMDMMARPRRPLARTREVGTVRSIRDKAADVVENLTRPVAAEDRSVLDGLPPHPTEPRELLQDVRPGAEVAPTSWLEKTKDFVQTRLEAIGHTMSGGREEALVRQAMDNLEAYVRGELLPNYYNKLISHFQSEVDRRRQSGDASADILDYIEKISLLMVEAQKKISEYIQAEYLQKRHKESRFTPWPWLPQGVKGPWTFAVSTIPKALRRTQYVALGGVAEILAAPYGRIVDYNESDQARGLWPTNSYARLMEIVPAGAARRRLRFDLLREVLGRQMPDREQIEEYREAVAPLWEDYRTNKAEGSTNNRAAVDAESLRIQIRNIEMEELRSGSPLHAIESDKDWDQEIARLIKQVEKASKAISGLDKLRVKLDRDNSLELLKKQMMDAADKARRLEAEGAAQNIVDAAKQAAVNLALKFQRLQGERDTFINAEMERAISRLKLEDIPVEKPADAADLPRYREELAEKLAALVNERQEIESYWEGVARNEVTPEMLKIYVLGKKVNAMFYRAIMLSTETQGGVVFPFDKKFDRHLGFIASWNSYWQLIADNIRTEVNEAAAEATPADRLELVRTQVANASTFWEGTRFPRLEKNRARKILDDIVQKGIAAGVAVMVYQSAAPAVQRGWETGSTAVRQEIHALSQTEVGESAQLAAERFGDLGEARMNLTAQAAEETTIGTLRESGEWADQKTREVELEAKWRETQKLVQIILQNTQELSEDMQEKGKGTPLGIAAIDPESPEAKELQQSYINFDAMMKELSIPEAIYISTKLQSEKERVAAEDAKAMAEGIDAFDLKRHLRTMKGYDEVLEIIDQYTKSQ